MAKLSSAPTIMVKKSDGTLVRMTLAEVAAYKKMKKEEPAVVSVSNKNPPSEHRPPGDAENAQNTPSTENKKTQNQKKFPPLVGEAEEGLQADTSNKAQKHRSTESTETHKAPVHHPPHHSSTKPAHPVLHLLSHREQKKEHPQGAKHKAHGTIEPRHLRPAIPAPVKPANSAWDEDDHRSLLEETIPVSNEHALTTSTPVTKIFQDEALAETQKNTPASQFVARPSLGSGSGAPESSAGRENIKAQKTLLSREPSRTPPASSRPPLVSPFTRQPNEPKLVLHDIVPPSPLEKISMSPVDELRSFTLADWRRMGPSVNQIESRLLSRFTTLQSESYPTYIEAVTAWKTSPLYQAYLALIVAALASARSITETIVAGGSGVMTKEEFMALVGINRELI